MTEVTTISPIVRLADLVVEDLNEAALGFQAVRGYLPAVLLDDLADDVTASGDRQLFVVVVPKAETVVVDTRASTNGERRIDIGLMKKLGSGSSDTFDASQLDDLMGIVQAVKDRLVFSRFAEFGWLRTENSPIFWPDHLATHRQFTSVVTVSYGAREIRR